MDQDVPKPLRGQRNNDICGTESIRRVGCIFKATLSFFSRSLPLTL
ncbi:MULTISPECIES: hypothetical protein [Pseudomonas]|nr:MULTISPECIES: hypothetical protein [Pseudomonas]